jgi:hypothetical protein
MIDALPGVTPDIKLENWLICCLAGYVAGVLIETRSPGRPDRRQTLY